MKIVTIVGARPQFIKAWPVSIELEKANITEVLIHTGQHYDPSMSDIFFNEFGMRRPDHLLNLGGGSHGQMTGRMIVSIENILQKEKPDAVLVYGDTNSTLAGALAASKILIPVIHIEAGLRSWNKAMPEEQNRILTDHLSQLLLCPTYSAIQNLSREGVNDHVYHVGDVMYDATKMAIITAKANSNILKKLDIKPNSYHLMTVHRAENTGSITELQAILNWVNKETNNHKIILPAHPRIQAMLRGMENINNIYVIEPVGYIDMTALLMNCSEVYTDSGGLQKEAYFHQKLCTTLRKETEWVETIENGWNRIYGQNYKAQKTIITEYGDGNASFLAAEYIKKIQ